MTANSNIESPCCARISGFTVLNFAQLCRNRGKYLSSVSVYCSGYYQRQNISIIVITAHEKNTDLFHRPIMKQSRKEHWHLEKSTSVEDMIWRLSRRYMPANMTGNWTFRPVVSTLYTWHHRGAAHETWLARCSGWQRCGLQYGLYSKM